MSKKTVVVKKRSCNLNLVLGNGVGELYYCILAKL